MAAEKKVVSSAGFGAEKAKRRIRPKRPEREVLHCAQDFASSWMLKLSKSETRAVQPLRRKSIERVADRGCAVYWT